ncbi:MAG TPA: M3 family metallopeptidase, partial [Opitutus sp.]|nr:M3 family metallopeptidase [Opitutus sp.]
MATSRVWLALTGATLLAACSDEPATNPAVTDNADPAAETAAVPVATENPFFEPSSLPLQYPPFDRIRDEHYLPAFERGMEEQLAEIAAITAQTEAPTFDNTILPLERSGRLLTRVANVFFALSSAHTNDAIQKLEVELSPRLSAHSDAILLDEALYARISDLYDRRDSLGLDPESLRLVEITHRDFVRAGAQLSPEDKDRLRAMNTELAELETTFSQNVLAEVNASAIVVDSSEELAGLSDAEIKAAADEAVARDMPGKYVLPLLNTSGQPLLSTLENRDLRQRIMETSLARGSRGGEFDNTEILSRTARLRAERAQLLGYPNHAAYVLEEQTALTVDAVNQRL